MHVTRKFYRKQLVSSGRLAFHGELLKLTTMDVSVAGVKVHLDINPEMRESTPVEIFLDELQLKGKAISVWSKPDEEGGCYMGLKFEKMEGGANTRLRYN